MTPATTSADTLFRLAAVRTDRETTAPDDETLRAYRDGGLSGYECRHVEWQLAHDAQARRRLADLAGIPAIEPSPRIRRAVLATAGSDLVPPTPPRRFPAFPFVLAAAATVVFVLLLGTVWRQADPSALPDGIVYRLDASALAIERGATSSLQADPDTSVHLTLTPNRAAADVTFTVYRDEGERLVRVTERDGLRLDVSRGAADIQAPAAALVAASLDTTRQHDVFVVAATATPPSTLRVRPGERAADALRRATDGQILTTTLTLRSDDSRLDTTEETR